MNLGKLAIIPLDQINFGNRRRENYGNIDGLVASIKKRGLIHPIAVQSDNGEPPYDLLAGGRRYLAFELMKETEISCRIYDHPLSKVEMKAIELLENIDREDLTYKEECNLYRDIHNLMLEIYGKKVSTAPGAEGWSLRDTANLLNKSVSKISEDIKIAETDEKLPELGLGECVGRSEALRTMERFEQTLMHSELAKRASEQLDDEGRKLADAYIVGDFFEEVKKIPDRVIDLVEIDPPYAIDLQGVKKLEGTSYSATYGSTYNEIYWMDYVGFITRALVECYRIMNDRSWLIMWFAPEPWFQPIYNTIIGCGFKCRRIPALWTKGTATGQTMQPQVYLGASYEMFFYARKGDAVINKQGRPSQFNFDPVSPALKIHPTERPVPLMKEILRTFAWEGARIVVPFAGSGNTLVAADDCGMIPWGCDLEQEYKDGYVSRLVRKSQ